MDIRSLNPRNKTGVVLSLWLFVGLVLIHHSKKYPKSSVCCVAPVGIYQDIQVLSSVWKYNPVYMQRCVFYAENKTRCNSPLGFYVCS